MKKTKYNVIFFGQSSREDTASNTIIYGGSQDISSSAKNTVILNMGADVIVYDSSECGNDIIKKTSGKTILHFVNVNNYGITKEVVGNNLVVSSFNSKITVQNYNKDKLDIVYKNAYELPMTSSYAKLSNPTANQTKKVFNEIWRNTGLAQA